MLHKFARFFAFSCVSLVAVVALAQLPTGTISGVVNDSTGAVIPGVSVTVTNVEMGASRSLITDAQGRYVVPNLRSGEYDLRASIAGFQTAVRTGIRVAIGEEGIVDFTLQIGEVVQEVVVTGEAPILNTTTSEVSGLVEAAQVEQLPLNGRSFADLMTLQPGVRYITAGSKGSVSGQGRRISLGGARGQDNTFLLDGSDITDKNSVVPGSVAGVLLGVDTVAEFKVLSNAYSAEYGTRAGGVMSAITRSGTNEFHGKVFEYFRNSALDARNFFDRDPGNPTVRSNPAPFKRNQFGFIAGGPIKENRTFFFGSFEGLRDRLGQTLTGRVPTLEARKGNLPSGPVEVDPGVAPYLDLWPKPNGRDFGDATAQLITSQSIPTNENYFLARVDHRFSDNYSMYGRYVFDDAEKLGASGTGLWRTQLLSRNQYATVQGSMIISPQLINSLQFAFNRTLENVTSPSGIEGLNESALEFLPGRGMGSLGVGGVSGLGPGALNPQTYISNRFQLIDNASYVRGAHNVKFGMVADRIQYNDFFGVRYKGQFAFTDLSALLQNKPRLFFGTIESDPVRGIRQWLMAFYAQDDIKVSSNLTLNLGLRYEFITVPTEVNGKISNLRDYVNDADFTVGDPYFQNPSLKNFAPRVGLAWDPFSDGKTSVRSGFGIFYDEILPYYYRATVNFVPPFNVNYALFGRSLPKAWVPGQPLPTAGRAILGTLEYVIPQPYALQYNLTVEREVLPGTKLTLGYRGYRGIKLLGISNANQRAPHENDEHNPDGRKHFHSDDPFPNPNFTDLYIYPARDSWYNGLDIGLNRRFRDGMQFQVSYSFGKSIDTASGHSGSTNLSSARDSGQDQTDPKGSERALSGHDIRNYFTAGLLYDLPFGRNLTGIADKLLGGWQTATLLTLTGGSPTTINLTFDRSKSNNRVYGNQNDRPDLGAGFSKNPTSGLTAGCGAIKPGQLGTPDRWYDPCAFELQTEGFFGNLGKNTVILPGLATFDFSLIKNTSIGESQHVEFRAEFFNLFNRANFGLPNRFIFRNSSGIPNASAGIITSTSTSSRQIQFALKFVF